MAEVEIDTSKMEVLETSMEVCDGPPLKKLKQVRLPFKPLGHTSQIQSTSPVSKKRKLSDNDSPSAKQMKTSSSKKNPTPVKVDSDPEVSSSSEADSNNLQGHKKGSKKTNTLDGFFKTPQNNKDEQEEISSTIDCIDLTDEKSGETDDDKREEIIPEDSLAATENDSCNATEEEPKEQIKVNEEGPEDRIARTTSIDEDDDKENQEESKPGLDQSFISDVSVCEDALKTPAKKKEDIPTLDESKDGDSAGTEDKKDIPSDTPNTPNTASKQPKTPGSTSRKAKLSESKKKEKEEQRLRREKELEEKRVQKQKEKEEKERVKSEKKKQKEQEKVEKEKAKQEEKEKKEQERLEKLKQKEEEKRQKEKENEAKMEAKLEEKKKKEEEKRQKEEERRLKEEEKKQKEEEKKKEEEEKLKKEEKKKESFKKFFIQKAPTVSPPKVSDNKKSIFMPFEVKPNMRLAPVHRVCLEEDQKSTLDGLMNTQDHEDTYMQVVKTNSFTARKSSKTWPRDLNEDKDVELLSHDKEVIEKVTHRAKYLYFHENTRPPFYGTWRKNSDKLSPRNPFKQDENLFDYEVDSDDEWEEEEPGESVSSDENEDDDKEKDEDDEDADGWMVPHGYLSDGEGAEDEEEVDNASKQDLQKIRQAAWESELKRQAKPLKMVAIGCYWSGDSMSNIAAQQLELLLKFKVVNLGCGSIPTTYSGAGVNTGSDKMDKKETGKSTPKTIKPVPEEAMPDLIRLVHGNIWGIQNLMKEFRTYWKRKTDPSTCLNDTANTSQLETSTMDTEEKAEHGESGTPKNKDNKTESEDDFSISKRQLFMKIQAIAVREKRPEYKKQCWYVNKDVLKKYNMEDVTIPNTWKYVCIKEPKGAVEKEKEKDKSDDTATATNNTTSTPSGRATPTIMQFAQPMSLSKIQALGMTPVNKETVKGAPADSKQITDTVVDENNDVEMKVETSLPTDQKTIKDMFSSQSNKKKAEKVMLSPTSTKLASQKKVLCKQGSPRIAMKRLVTPKKNEVDDLVLIEKDQCSLENANKTNTELDMNIPTTPKSCGSQVLESIMTSPELMKASPEMNKCNVNCENKEERENKNVEAMDVDDVIVLD